MDREGVEDLHQGRNPRTAPGVQAADLLERRVGDLSTATQLLEAYPGKTVYKELLNKARRTAP